MDGEATKDIACPMCSAKMEQGWVAIWNPIVFQKVRWQATKPGWVRMRVPEGSQVLLEARVGGEGARIGMRCPQCATTVLPPDATYD